MDLSIPAFDRAFFTSEHTLTRIGDGDLGGKAEGLRRVKAEILSDLGDQYSPYFDVVVPTLTVLTTAVFDSFIASNEIDPTALSELRDDQIAHLFQRCELPPEHLGDLRGLISAVHSPLAVRSSSALEDALDHPFAGVYATKMIPNNEIEEDERFRRLIEAIKLVYASTFFADARAYLSSTGRRPGEEKMAVVIQEVVGQCRNNRFYPCLSGVARSYNFYPSGSARPDDGVVNLALGLGKTIVDGGLTWHYSPASPKAPPPFNSVGELLKNTQTSFWAVNMGPPPLPDPIRETECLVRGSLADAEADDVLKYLASTYDAASDRLNPGLGGKGPRALTFAPLVGSRLIPFNELVCDLLARSRAALGSHVEIELAVRLDRRDAIPARFGFLQLRPMAVSSETTSVTEAELHADEVVVASTQVLGNGLREGISDVVFIDPERFDPARTQDVTRDLETINRSLAEQRRDFVLIGFGRWGTSDARLGIPVTWPQISGARVIVEATLPTVQPDLSQGSHFFHNLLSFKVLYLSVEHDSAYPIDWTWLRGQEVVTTSGLVTHVRTPQPLTVRVDGRSGKGVILRHGGA